MKSWAGPGNKATVQASGAFRECSAKEATYHSYTQTHTIHILKHVVRPHLCTWHPSYDVDMYAYTVM